jgi:hypothetical protein
MSKPLFTDEGPQYYSAAYRHNAPFAKPAPYNTKLNPQQEKAFRGWVLNNHVPFDVNDPVQDYDMRGFWLSKAKAGTEPGGGVGYPDTFKTPYDTTFSAESKYATANCPFVWHGDNLVDLRDGTLVFSRGASSGGHTGGMGIDLDRKHKHGAGWGDRALPTGPRMQTVLPGAKDIPGSTGISVPAGARKSSLGFRNGFRVQHADGTETRHTLSLVGPKSYESDQQIQLRPGDVILMDGDRQ